MNWLKIWVVIYTTTKQEEAHIQMDIIRDIWKELFKDIVIVHVYNGIDEYFNYTEDEHILCDNPSHYEGAANMMDRWMEAMMKYDRDYIVVSASDSRWTKPEKLMEILVEMRLNNRYLASCPWWHKWQDDRKLFWLTCDTFIVDAHREKEHNIFPLWYWEFYRKNIDILHYLWKYTIPVENLLAAKFISACSRTHMNSQVKNIVNNSLYIIKERVPMMTDNKRNFDCLELWILTNHDLIYKKAILNNPSLQTLWEQYGTDKATLHTWFLPFYESILCHINVKSLLEIGVYQGDSMRMWRAYFPEAEIMGIDINEPLEIPGCTILKTDASVMRLATMYDVIIDDGSHMMSEQKRTFTNLRWNVNPGGVYIIEDIHTSFLNKYIDEKPITYDRIRNFADNNYIQYKEFWKDKSTFTNGTIILFKGK